MAWRINALNCASCISYACDYILRNIDPALTQLAMNWALLGASLVIAIPAVLSITPSPVREVGVPMEDGERYDHDEERKA